MYRVLGKALEKQVKTIEKQWEKQRKTQEKLEEKRLVRINGQVQEDNSDV